MCTRESLSRLGSWEIVVEVMFNHAQPHVVNFNRLDSTCGLNCLEELSWRVYEIMPKICVVSLTWCFSFSLVPWPCYSMHVYVCKCGFVTSLDVMLRIPLAHEWSTKSDSSDFGYEFVTVRSGNTTNAYYSTFSWMGVYVVNKGDWSTEIKRDIYQVHSSQTLSHSETLCMITYLA